jgi:hypothetical protein
MKFLGTLVSNMKMVASNFEFLATKVKKEWGTGGLFGRREENVNRFLR